MELHSWDICLQENEDVIIKICVSQMAAQKHWTTCGRDKIHITTSIPELDKIIWINSKKKVQMKKTPLKKKKRVQMKIDSIWDIWEIIIYSSRNITDDPTSAPKTWILRVNISPREIRQVFLVLYHNRTEYKFSLFDRNSITLVRRNSSLAEESTNLQNHQTLAKQ